MIGSFLEKKDGLHGICFVLKASLNRLTSAQQYIMEQVLKFFGKEAGDHIFIMLTFADAGSDNAIAALRDAKIPYKDAFKFNNSGVYP